MNNKNISIIGTGKIGQALATLWSRKGHSIYLGSRNPNKHKLISSDYQYKANICAIDEAITRSNIIVLAVPHQALDNLTSMIKNNVHGKIIIDATNPFGLSKDGRVISTLGKNITQGTHIAKLLPQSIIIRAFSHIMDELLISRGTQQPGLFAVAIAGDDNTAKHLVSELVVDTGFVPVDIGKLVQSSPLDPGGCLFPQFFTVADMKATLVENDKKQIRP